MRIGVQFCGRLSDAFGAEAAYDLPEGVYTVGAVRDHLRTVSGSDALHHPTVRAVLNDDVVAEDHTVSNGDRLAFLPPVGGG